MTTNAKESFYTRMVVLFGEWDVDWEYLQPVGVWKRLWLRQN